MRHTNITIEERFLLLVFMEDIFQMMKSEKFMKTHNLFNQKQLQDETTVLFSNLETTTPYKIYDDSDNGIILLMGVLI